MAPATKRKNGFQGSLPERLVYVWDQLSLQVGRHLHFAAMNRLINQELNKSIGGSDVANLKTTAVKSADGKYYIVNGHKVYLLFAKDDSSSVLAMEYLETDSLA